MLAHTHSAQDGNCMVKWKKRMGYCLFLLWQFHCFGLRCETVPSFCLHSSFVGTTIHVRYIHINVYKIHCLLFLVGQHMASGHMLGFMWNGLDREGGKNNLLNDLQCTQLRTRWILLSIYAHGLCGCMSYQRVMPIGKRVHFISKLE